MIGCNDTFTCLSEAFRCVRTLMAVSATEEKSTSRYASSIGGSEIRKQIVSFGLLLGNSGDTSKQTSIRPISL